MFHLLSTSCPEQLSPFLAATYFLCAGERRRVCADVKTTKGLYVDGVVLVSLFLVVHCLQPDERQQFEVTKDEMSLCNGVSQSSVPYDRQGDFQ